MIERTPPQSVGYVREPGLKLLLPSVGSPGNFSTSCLSSRSCNEEERAQRSKRGETLGNLSSLLLFKHKYLVRTMFSTPFSFKGKIQQKPRAKYHAWKKHHLFTPPCLGVKYQLFGMRQHGLLRQFKDFRCSFRWWISHKPETFFRSFPGRKWKQWSHDWKQIITVLRWLG